MLTIKQYSNVKRVRDGNPFTRTQPLNDYLEGARTRYAKWFGIDVSKVTIEEVYDFLVKDLQ